MVAILSVTDVIRRHSETLSVERRNISSVVGGFHQEGMPDIFNIVAHIQQARQKDMENAPEGQRTEDTRVIWTETKLKVADRITEAGIEYIVQSLEHWKQGPFYKTLAVEVDDTLHVAALGVFTPAFSGAFA